MTTTSKPVFITSVNSVHTVPDQAEELSIEPFSDEEEQVKSYPQNGVSKADTLKAWLEEEENSDDYDTDLESDFPLEPLPPADATGMYDYGVRCRRQGVVPVSFLCRNMGEGNLRMRHHYLGGKGTVPLAEALKNNTVCEEVDLSDNYVEGEGAAALADMLKDNMFIVNLNVSNNFIRCQGVDAFADMLDANTTLKTLSLQGNQLTDSGALKISEALKNNQSLSCLDLSHNQFSEVGGIHLANGIANNIGLSDLDLSWNCIRAKGAVAICKAVGKNASLEILDLSWNGIAPDGAIALGQSLKTNKSLKVLDISNNRIGTEAAKKLAQGLAKNHGLETLLLGMNPIAPEGVEAILKAVAVQPTLKLLGLEDISLTPAVVAKVKEMEANRDIMIMHTTGSPQQAKINQTVLAVFDRFINDNLDRLEDLFNQMDKDKSGDITLEEFKYGLKDFGLRLTNKQLDMLLDSLDADKSGTIEFSELVSGSEMVQQEREKAERHIKEAQLYQERDTRARPKSVNNKLL